jgi:hypothetical protein
MQTFEVDRGSNGGAIWAAGNAPAVDSSGNIWTSTGNGASSSFNYQESVIKLDSNLNVLDHWSPSNWSSLDSSDTDLGSSMPLLLGGGLVFQIGKAGVGYLLSASGLGGTGAPPLYQASVCNGSYGGGIYDNGGIYVACSNGLHALSLNSTTKAFAPVSGWAVNSSATGPPIFAGGLVWSAGTGNGVLYGLDAGSGATRFSANLGRFEHFTSPSAGGGRLFIANGDRVTAFQIATAPGAAATTTRLSSSANPSRAGAAVRFTAIVRPVPDAGTIAFTQSGRAIPGCSAINVGAGSGQAACTTRYRVAARHAIVAIFSGDSYFAASHGALTQVVAASAPAISHLRLRAVHRKLRLTLTLSKPAKLTVVVSRFVAGRITHRRCRAGARRGRHCQTSVRKGTLRLSGARGRKTYNPRMHPLPPGRYTVTVSAVSSDGGHSKRHTAIVIVPSA